LAVLILLLVIAVSGSHLLGVRMCVFHHLTGYPCLTCGGTRAVAHLLNGELGAAFCRQPLVTVICVGIVPFLLLRVLLRRLGLGFASLLPPALRNKWIIIAVAAALVVANWIYIIHIGN